MAPSPSARLLLDLRKPPFCAFPRVTAKLAGKLGDRSLYGPLQEVQLLQPLEPALNVAALDQSFDRLDRPVLPTHSNEYRRVVAPRLRMSRSKSLTRYSAVGFAPGLSEPPALFSQGPPAFRFARRKSTNASSGAGFCRRLG